MCQPLLVVNILADTLSLVKKIIPKIFCYWKDVTIVIGELILVEL